ncbi:MAG: polysaccharide deacetylase family protein [Acidobacteriota bacterium]
MRKIKCLGIVLIIFIIGFYAFWQVSKARTFQLMGEIVPRVETNEKVVALTFDDGPTPEYTDEILQILKENEVKATFFLIGADIEKYPESAKQIVAAGHEIGNHSYSHERMFFKTPSFIQREIDDTDKLIRESGYAGDIHFRSPYGKKFLLLPYYLSRRHKKNIMWDVEPNTFPEIDKDAEKTVEYTIANTKPGSIILLHVMYEGREASMKAVPGIIQGLKAQGFTFKTVSELLALKD